MAGASEEVADHGDGIILPATKRRRCSGLPAAKWVTDRWSESLPLEFKALTPPPQHAADTVERDSLSLKDAISDVDSLLRLYRVEYWALCEELHSRHEFFRKRGGTSCMREQTQIAMPACTVWEPVRSLVRHASRQQGGGPGSVDWGPNGPRGPDHVAIAQTAAAAKGAVVAALRVTAEEDGESEEAPSKQAPAGADADGASDITANSSATAEGARASGTRRSLPPRPADGSPGPAAVIPPPPGRGHVGTTWEGSFTRGGAIGVPDVEADRSAAVTDGLAGGGGGGGGLGSGAVASSGAQGENGGGGSEEGEASGGEGDADADAEDSLASGSQQGDAAGSPASGPAHLRLPAARSSRTGAALGEPMAAPPGRAPPRHGSTATATDTSITAAAASGGHAGVPTDREGAAKAEAGGGGDGGHGHRAAAKLGAGGTGPGTSIGSGKPVPESAPEAGPGAPGPVLAAESTGAGDDEESGGAGGNAVVPDSGEQGSSNGCSGQGGGAGAVAVASGLADVEASSGQRPPVPAGRRQRSPARMHDGSGGNGNRTGVAPDGGAGGGGDTQATDADVDVVDLTMAMEVDGEDEGPFGVARARAKAAAAGEVDALANGGGNGSGAGRYGDAALGQGDSCDEGVVTFSEVEDAVVRLPPGALTAPRREMLAWRRRFLAHRGRALRLERVAGAASTLMMDAEDALACLVGVRMRFLLRRYEVSLGRSSDSKGAVDVDLAQEAGPGPAARRVSRLQAQLGLRRDGAASVTNVGRRLLLVNNAPVPRGSSVSLPHLSLLEVGGVSLLFLMNPLAVARLTQRAANINA